MEPTKDRMHGTLDLLVLRALTDASRHGYAIMRWIEEQSGEHIRVEEGSLYPALYRMERKGWIVADWGISELGRRAKFYRVTALGRRHLEEETAEWARFTSAVWHLLLVPAG